MPRWCPLPIICQEFVSCVHSCFSGCSPACAVSAVKSVRAVSSSRAPMPRSWYGTNPYNFVWHSAKLLKRLCCLFCVPLQNCNCVKTKKKTTNPQNLRKTSKAYKLFTSILMNAFLFPCFIKKQLVCSVCFKLKSETKHLL